MVKNKKSGQIERLNTRCIREVMELEKMCFAYHWTEEQFRLGLERKAFHMLGMREKNRLVGYVAFSMILDEMEILNLAVHPEWRRRGIAGRLMSAMLEVCSRQGIRSGFLDVKESNTPAIALYESFGFRRHGVRKRYYPDTKEDALLYRYDFLTDDE